MTVLSDPYADVPPPAGPTDNERMSLDAQVAAEVIRQRVQAAAGEILASERADSAELPSPVRLDKFLAQPDPAVLMRVEGLLPIGGRILFTAAAKGGKSTARNGLIESLVDGRPFLGQFDVRPVQRLVLVENELHDSMQRRWFRELGIEHTERVEIISLRGRVGTFDILNDATRARWAKLIGPADVLILDCLRPCALDALGLDSEPRRRQVRRRIHALLAEAGIGEAVVIHHMGHGAERSRGDSRLRDWPYAEWRIVRERGDDTDDINPDARRYFAAYGRDVNVPEGLLEYDSDTQGLRLAGGSRRDARTNEARAAVLALLNEHPEGLSGRAVEEHLLNTPTTASKPSVRHSVKPTAPAYARSSTDPTEAESTTSPPKEQPVRHSASLVRQRTRCECAQCVYKRRTHTHCIQSQLQCVDRRTRPIRDKDASSLDRRDDGTVSRG